MKKAKKDKSEEKRALWCRVQELNNSFSKRKRKTKQ